MEKIGFGPMAQDERREILASVGYTEEKLNSDILYIRKWLSYQHHLPKSAKKENDAFITNFLLGCKGSLEKCKRKLDNYYTARNHSVIFDQRDPSIVIDKNEGEITGIWAVKQTACLFAKCQVEDTSRFDFERTAKRIMNQIEIFLRLNIVTTNHFWVGDGAGYNPSRVFKMNPLIIKDFLKIIQDVLPFGIKGIIFINAPQFLEAIVNKVVKPLLSSNSKLSNRLYVYSKGSEMLMNHFEIFHLPSDLGGMENGTLIPRRQIYDIWTMKELQSRSWFINEGAEKVDENKRRKRSNGDSFGVQGSLRTLDID